MPCVNTHNTGLNGAVAAELRAQRARIEITQEEVSARSGVPLVTVQRMLAAKRPIDVAMLDKLARALETDAASVLGAAAIALMRGQDGATGT